MMAAFFVIYNGGCVNNPSDVPIDYKQEMRDFVQDISRYAKSANVDFIVIPQNGAEIVSTTGEDTGLPDMNYINAIDGIGQESLYYGYYADDQETPLEDRQWTSAFLDMAKDNGNIVIFVTDYCYSHYRMDDSYGKNDKKGYISFAADHRELDDIPNYPAPIENENDSVITELSEAKNFLYLINPQLFSTRQGFVDAVGSTNYDLVIMDFFFNGEEYTQEQINRLKEKNNGGRRLLISYMSIGEAEDYRYYWQNDWRSNPPDWLEEENPNWAGNYKVAYWYSEWQDIIYGKGDSYLDRILAAGFDGVYLDIIDAFEYFEEQ
ncbi:endo alpha-1,4 polygalactosaminidase [bacterium]|nr:endo alpha-1,4 polygalactosaminidase [bacterium]